jgi:hypothetical protein
MDLNMVKNISHEQTFYNSAIVKIDDDSSVTFKNSSSSLNGTNISKGQIPGIILSRPDFR